MRDGGVGSTLGWGGIQGGIGGRVVLLFDFFYVYFIRDRLHCFDFGSIAYSGVAYHGQENTGIRKV
jgi:hypothetical protein